MVVAIKFYDDTFFDNEYYSKVGGISCVEMNLLEVEILQMLDYNLSVGSEEYEKYREHIARLYTSLSPVPDKERKVAKSKKIVSVTSPTPAIETKQEVEVRGRNEVSQQTVEIMCDQVSEQH